MRLAESIEVSAPPAAVWALLNDPSQTLEYMAGVTRWELASDQESGVGARYRMLMRVGSAEVGSLVEIVEASEPRDLAWTSVTGIDQRARWRLRERADGRTHVEFRLSYGVAGAGPAGWLAERLGAPQVRRNVRRSLIAMKRMVESAQLQQTVVARRSAP